MCTKYYAKLTEAMHDAESAESAHKRLRLMRKTLLKEQRSELQFETRTDGNWEYCSLPN